MEDRVNNPKMLTNKDGIVLGIEGGWVFVDPEKVNMNAPEMVTRTNPNGSGSGYLAYPINTRNNGSKITIPSTVEIPKTPGWVWTGSDPAPTRGSWYFINTRAKTYRADSPYESPYEIQKGGNIAYFIGPNPPDNGPMYVLLDGSFSMSSENTVTDWFDTLTNTKENNLIWTRTHVTKRVYNQNLLSNRNNIRLLLKTLFGDSLLVDGLKLDISKLLYFEYSRDENAKIFRAISDIVQQKIPLTPLQATLNTITKARAEHLAEYTMQNKPDLNKETNLKAKIKAIPNSLIQQDSLKGLKALKSTEVKPISGGYRKKTLRRRSIKHRRKTATRSRR